MNRSYSQFSAFAMCPRKHVLSRKYDTKVKAAALAEGDVFHLTLGKMYAQGKAEAGKEILDFARNNYLEEANKAGSSPEAIEKLEAKFAALVQMIETYKTMIFTEDMKRYEVLETEKSFRVKAGRGLWLNGFVDGVWKSRESGVRFIVEHKYKSSHDEELMSLDLQVSLYTLALVEQYGGPLPTLYNVALKPQNRRSEGEPLDAFVKRVVKSIEKDAADFKWAPEYASKRFIRRAYSRGRGELKAVLDQIRSMNRVMTRIEKDPSLAWRNPGDHCLWMCQYKPLCIDEDPMIVDRFFDLKNPVPEKKASV